MFCGFIGKHDCTVHCIWYIVLMIYNVHKWRYAYVHILTCTDVQMYTYKHVQIYTCMHSIPGTCTHVQMCTY